MAINRRKSNQSSRSKKKNKKDSRKKRNPLTKEHSNYLSLLSKARNKNRRDRIIDLGTGKEIKAVSECIHNVLFGNVKLSPYERKTLVKYKKVLKSLSHKCQPIREKKRVLKQKGGFLQYLIPAAITAVTSLFGR